MAETDNTQEPDEGPLSGLRQWLRQLRGEPEQAQGLRAALVEMLGEGDDEQPIDPHERTLIGNILKLHSLVASDVMVPRVDIMALDIETSFAEATKQMIEVGHSRVPVFHETLDDIVGMIHIKDLLPFAVDGRQPALSEIARKPLFVAPTMALLDLLLQMRLSRTHLALVVDEFGGTDGLVTIEDVIEEIVGEIEDEHDDADRPKLVARSDGTFLAPGRTPIEALETHIDGELVPEGFEEGVTTLGGLVVALAGHVPVRGELVKHPLGFEFEVLDADPRRVKRLRVRGLSRKPANRHPPNMDRATVLELRGSAGPEAPLQRGALWFASLTRWHRHLAALLLGALAAASLPPVDMTPVLLISFPGLVWLSDGNTSYRSAFTLGWSFGFGFFLAGLYWIAAALFVDIAQFWWLVPIAVAGVPAGLAIFTGAALLVSHALCRVLRLGATGRVLALVFCWCGAEWLRGHILTGFPWNLVGYAWSGAFPGALALLQFASLAGIYGLSLLTVLVACLPARLGDFSGRRGYALGAAVVLLVLPAAWGTYRLANGHTDDVPNVTLRLVQPSIPQTMKQDPAALLGNFRRLFALSTSSGTDAPTAIIWPEDAAPPFLDRDGGARQALAQAVPQNGYIITGTTRTDPAPEPPTHVWNSMVAVDHDGEIRASYDKFHLVPFGEYVPLRGILPMQKITPGAIDFSEGPGPRTITLPGLPPFSPLICYEAIFPDAVVDPAHRPDWLLNITDDAWYGFTSGPFQHLAIARLRAIEEGLPLARAGDNGVSAMFDPYGRVTARLALDDIGVLDVKLPQPLPPTLYSRIGDIPFFGAMLLIMATILWPRLSSLGFSRKI